jgi:hypothetical protein
LKQKSSFKFCSSYLLTVPKNNAFFLKKIIFYIKNYNMKFLKQGLVVLTAVLFLTACTQEDSDCTPPAVEQNIVGTWTVTGGVATVEFQADGTLVDPSDDVLGAVINGDTLSVKTYSVANDTLYAVAASPTTVNTIDAQFPISKNECDKITLSLIGLPVVLTRE